MISLLFLYLQALPEEVIVCLSFEQALNSIQEFLAREAHLFRHLRDVEIGKFALSMGKIGSGDELVVQIELEDAMMRIVNLKLQF